MVTKCTLHAPSMHPPHTLCAPTMHPPHTLCVASACPRMFSIAYMSPPQLSAYPLRILGCFQLPTCLHLLCVVGAPSTRPPRTLHVPSVCHRTPSMCPLHTHHMPSTCPPWFLIGYMCPPHPIILLGSRT